MVKRFQKFLKSPALIRLLLKGSFLGLVALFFIELFFYTGVIQHNLGVSFMTILGGVAIFHLWARLHKKITLEEEFSVANLVFVAPATFLIALVMYFLEDGGPLYPNYFFQNFKVDYHALYMLAFSAALLGLVQSTKQVFARYGRILYVFAILIVLAEAGKFFLRDFGGYLALVWEDGPVENLTSIMYLVSGGLALLMTKHKALFAKHTRGQKLFTALCVVLALGFFVIAGEEISWGQRLFGWEFSETALERNLQGETNIHNHEAIFPYVYTGYALIGLYGILSGIVVWVFADFWPKKGVFQNWLALLAPDAFLFFNFAMTIIYVRQRPFSGPWQFSYWEELSELLLITGIATHLVQRYWEFTKIKKAKR